jgi:hypothetical protein
MRVSRQLGSRVGIVPRFGLRNSFSVNCDGYVFAEKGSWSRQSRNEDTLFL